MPTVFELLGGKRRMSLPQTVQIKSHRGKKIITYEDADLFRWRSHIGPTTPYP